MSHDANGTWTWRVLIASHLDVFLASIVCSINHKLVMILTKTKRGIAALADATFKN